MARKFLTAIDLTKCELQNAAIQNLAAAPSAPVKGQLYYDTVSNILYWYNGTAWVAAQGGGALTPASTVTTQAVGDAPVVGASTNYAREDHKHGREAFGVITAQTAFGAAKSDGAATTVARSDHVHGTPTHVDADHSTIHLNALAIPTASVNMGNQTITSLGSPSNGTDAATKFYVDSAIAGLSWKAAVKLATTANITLSAHQTIDGVLTTTAVRVLVKNQTNQSENGIYAAGSGAWARVADVDTAAEMLNMTVFVSEGTTQADTAWTCTAVDPITLGTTALPFVQFAGGASVTDGDKGDITVSGGGTAWAIDPNTVNNVKLADMAQNTMKGRWSSGTGDPEDLSGGQIAVILGSSVPRRYAQAVGDGAALSYTVSHNFNSQDVLVQVRRAVSPFDRVEPDIEYTNLNTVTVRFAVAPTANQYWVDTIG